MNRKVFDLVICSALAAVAMTLALLAPEIGQVPATSRATACAPQNASAANPTGQHFAMGQG